MFSRVRRRETMVGFALSGGGARGAVQVGAIRALREAGIRPQLLAGTSAGAVTAAYLALNPDRLDELERIWLGLRQRDVFPGGRLRMLHNITRHGYVHHSGRLERFLRRHVGNARFEDCAIPCAVVAVRLNDGAPVVFDSGELVPAVMASTAIPGVFPPFRIGDHLYADGGVLEYLPIRPLVERCATEIYALDCSHFEPAHSESVVERCALIGSQAASEQAIRLHAGPRCCIHLLRPKTVPIRDARDFSHTAELIASGYQHTREFLQVQRVAL